MRLVIVSFALLAAAPALAKECRIPDARPGVRAQLPPGCEKDRRGTAERQVDERLAGGEAGFVDLGNGTKVRVGGRVRAEMGVGR